MGWIEDRVAKWKLHRFYSKHPAIARTLPPTARMTIASLRTFLNAYRSVYVKANTQHTGKGVIKAWKSGSGYKYVFVRGQERSEPSVEGLNRAIRQINPKLGFIVQKSIDLAAIGGRPYDIRVMMMRNRERKWQFAGMVAKVHGRSSIVSNVRRGGGYVTSVENALTKSGFQQAERERIMRRLIQISRIIMSYSESYPFYSYQSGIDLAVDKKGKIWLIEVNLHNPAHFLFKQLRDQTYYKRVRQLYGDYRRHNKKLI